MSHPHRRIGRSWWLAIVAIILIVYPLSYGPVGWMLITGRMPALLVVPLDWFYAPLGWALRSGPQPVLDLFNRYMSYWVAG